MTAKGSITLRLTDDQRERLERQAKRRGVPPAKLALEFLLVGLLDMEENADKHWQQALEALAALRQIREDMREAGYPSVDVAEVMRQSREDLEEKTDRWLWL